LGDEAFRWAGGVMTGLSDLTGGSFVSAALAVSADGSVVVGRARSGSGTEAFRWSAGDMTGLGDLPGGPFQSIATGISADGGVIVGQGAGAEGTEAVMWADGVLTGLGDLSGGPFYSHATGVSADGRVVVGQSYGGNGLEAFVWTQAAGMRSVRALLVEAGAVMTGWTLWSAHGVSADGQGIVGLGVNPQGDAEGWLAVLPPRPVATQPAGAPVDLALHAPAPNPAADRVAIRYDLPAAGRVRLEVYDALGREVAVLVDGDLPAGVHEAVLHVGRLAPGVYVARLAAGAGQVGRHLVVAR
jgi:probable HAF family extracellular repeat protein